MSGLAFGALAALGPFIEYLRPSKSPYLLMVIFGTLGIDLSAKFYAGEDKWLLLLLPQYIALFIFTLFAYFSREKADAEKTAHPTEEQEEQLKFSRALSIASAIMCLAIGSLQVLDKGALFYINYLVCLFQLVIFIIYSAARLYKEEAKLDFNFFQYSFITSVYLIGATFAIGNIEYDGSLDSSYIFNEAAVDAFFLTSVILYGLWLFCQIFWIKRILSLLRIVVVD